MSEAGKKLPMKYNFNLNRVDTQKIWRNKIRKLTISNFNKIYMITIQRNLTDILETNDV